jgi:dTDP-glucose pyrophosphorylase
MTDPNFWRKTLLPMRSTVKEAIANLNDTGLRIVLVVADDGTLAGTITDGDVRRGLLRGIDLDNPVSAVLNVKPLIAPPQLGADIVLQLMQANGINQLPIIDDSRQVVGLHLWNELIAPAQHENIVVLMAGGMGKRLRPFTEDCPKPLLPVAGKPMLEHVIERARGDGFHRFAITIHHLGHMIRDYFGDGSRWNVRIDYVREEAPLGTAGALSLLDPRPDAPFIVANGDVLTDIRYADLLDFHNRHHSAATMAVRQYEWQHPFGVVHTKGVEIVGFEEKPIARSHINAGVYAIEPDSLSQLRRNEPCDMPTLFNRLQQAGKQTIAYPMHEPWLDVGRPDDLRLAQHINTREG